MIKKYAVIGNPIAQSQSPEIHLRFAAQFGHTIEYTRILANAANFNDTVVSFINSGGLGMNVTAPFKLQAAQLSSSLSVRAKIAQAVNTLIFKNNKIFGDNTDGLGLVRDIENNLGHKIANQRVLILGAGGAARGILLPILDAKPAALTVVNRTAERAIALAADVAIDDDIQAGGFELAQGKTYDIVINATSAGLDRAKLPALNYSFAAQGLAYDLVYGQHLTPFMQQAQQAGADQLSDGLGMLVEQAAYSYRLWHGVMPATVDVLAELRRQAQI